MTDERPTLPPTGSPIEPSTEPPGAPPTDPSALVPTPQPAQPATVEPAIVEPATGEPAVAEPGPPFAVTEPAPSAAVPPGRRFGPVALITAGVVGAALLGAVVLAATSLGRPAASPSPSPDASIAAFAAGRTIGRADAPVTVEIWADFQCPYCKLLTEAVEGGLVLRHAPVGDVRFVYRDFAFLGQESVDAAIAARCADRQGAFWPYHDLLFAAQQGENQGAFAKDRLISLATFGNLDTAKFTACLTDKTALAEVAAETETGKGYGVSSTPTIRVIGPGGTQLILGMKDYATFEKAIEAMARPAPSGSASASPSPAEGGSPVASPAASPSP